MQRVSSNIWSHRATASTAPLCSINIATGAVSSALLDAATVGYLQQTIDSMIASLSASEYGSALGAILPRLISVTPLTGVGELTVGATDATANVTLTGMVPGDVVLVQIPHSTTLALFAPPPPATLGYRTFTLGDAGTGLWYVTIAARASSAELFAISVLKNADLSTPGPLGTFAIDVGNVEGLSLYSVSAFTYTRVATQPKVLLLIDNPQGPVFAHQVARCSAVQTTTNGAQSMTPIVSVAREDGSVPAANGLPHQIDPAESYPRLRVSAVGFTAASEDAVTDPAFNKPQTLVVQF